MSLLGPIVLLIALKAIYKAISLLRSSILSIIIRKILYNGL